MLPASLIFTSGVASGVNSYAAVLYQAGAGTLLKEGAGPT